MLKRANNEELVKEKSKGPKPKGTIFVIENCSKGEKNIKDTQLLS